MSIFRWHFHKYTTLLMFPPRPIYEIETWDFVLLCKCGKTKLTKLPYKIEEVHTMCEAYNGTDDTSKVSQVVDEDGA